MAAAAPKLVSMGGQLHGWIIDVGCGKNVEIVLEIRWKTVVKLLGKCQQMLAEHEASAGLMAKAVGHSKCPELPKIDYPSISARRTYMRVGPGGANLYHVRSNLFTRTELNP